MKIKSWKIFENELNVDADIIRKIIDSGMIDPFIEEIKKNQEFNIIYRGVYDSSLMERSKKLYDGIFLRKRRKSRKPLDTNDHVSKEIDRVSKEKFDFKLRSEAVFTSKLLPVAKSYGRPYIFFPVGNYRYFWRYGVDDLWNYLDGQYWYPDKFTPFDLDEIKNGVEDLVKYYNQGSNNDSAMSDITTEEISFDCHEYLLIDMKYQDQIEKQLGIVHYSFN